MYSANFKYYSPRTVAEAVKLLQEHGEEARILAGGMSLIPMMKMRLVSVNHLIDIGKIDSMKGIAENGSDIVIGGATTHHAIETSPLIQKEVPLMSEVASWIGDPQVRNKGTIGGSLSHADPSGDWGACIIALKGKIMVSNGEKERAIDSDDFFVDMYETSIKAGEILTRVSVPAKSGKGHGFSYMNMERKAGDFATVGVATQLELDDKGNCSSAGIGLTAVGRTPMRASEAEEFLLGKKVGIDGINEAAKLAVKSTDPTDDPLRGSAEFKKAMCEVYTRRSLRTAFERAGGAI